MCSPQVKPCAQLFLILALFGYGSFAFSGTWDQLEPGIQEQTQEMGKLAEGTVVLSRVHPVISDNFPDFKDSSAAAALIQTHESRVPHYHVMRLREAHETFRNPPASLFEKEAWSGALNESSSKLQSDTYGHAAIRMTNLKD